MKLNEIEIGHSAVVKEVGGTGALRQHFLDMGLIPGVNVTLVKYAPMGDPLELRLHGYELTLRKADAGQIEVDEVIGEKDKALGTREEDLTADGNWSRHKHEHPGLGESGKFHRHEGEHPLPTKQTLTFALIGNQNCGKTTLFNQLTGASQHVGNFPGVTVDRKDGQIKGQDNTRVTDLPGIYSLSPYTSEEVVSRQFILEERPTCIINIVDANNIERNLYLTVQLMELDIPMVVALNMMDEVENNGGTVRINEIEEMLGVPVIPISAMKNQGVDELIRHAMHVARYQEPPTIRDICSPSDHGGAVHRCIHAVMHLIEDHAEAANIPVRFAANKLIEGDLLVQDALHLSENEQKTVRHIIRQMEEERGIDSSAAMAEMRFSFIQRVSEQTVVKPIESKEHRRSRRIDKLLTGRWTAIPSFLLIMGFIFWITFQLIGGNLQDLMDEGITGISALLAETFESWNINPYVSSLILDGAWAGVGSVLTFIPIILCLFFFLSMLEDSGYMARIAFVTDSLLRKIGLSGRSIVPMLIGFGCSVPSIMATRTLPSDRDRKLTIMLTPFMSCTAKIAIYGFLARPFFGDKAWMVMIGLYLLGIVSGILVAVMAKLLVFKGEAVPFVMELPNYRLPALKNVGQLLWEKTKDFLQKAFTIIFVATIVIWFLQHFDFHFNLLEDENVEQSILATVAGIVAPIFSPLGFGNWQTTTALVTGFIAKENVCAIMEQVYGGADMLHYFMTPTTVITLLVFCLLYTPCIAAIATIRRELGNKWAASMVIGQCAIAWVIAAAVQFIISISF
ncbi:MAG: ferrous iron transport protein B [Bacteroidaceae bacterium]|nr:ferrous iron transport protein B [Bacteroidaceae bacterium]